MTDFRALCVELVVALGRAAAGLNSGTAHAGDRAAWAHEAFQTAARAESALAQPAPPAEGEVGELVALIRQIALAWEPDACLLGNMTAGQLSRTAELLQQRHPAPVPVSERLPGPEDCTTNPRNGRGQWCWGWVQHDQPPYSGRWRMMLREWLSDEAVAWLPATALPLPAGEGQATTNHPTNETP